MTAIVSPPSGSRPAANGASDNTAISQDDREVRLMAFDSLAANLVLGDTNGRRDVFVLRKQRGSGRLAGALMRVSIDSRGRQANGESSHPALDGTTRPGESRSYDYDSTFEAQGLSGIFPGSTTDVYRPYAREGGGSISGLESATGDIASNETYTYDSFGSTTTSSATPAAAANPFRFQGFYYDSGLGQYDMQARMYRPGIARFLSQDRYESAADDFNLVGGPTKNDRYSFLGGNPVSFVELDGHHGACSGGNQMNCESEKGGGSKKVHKRRFHNKSDQNQRGPAIDRADQGGDARPDMGVTAPSNPRTASKRGGGTGRPSGARNCNIPETGPAAGSPMACGPDPRQVTPGPTLDRCYSAAGGQCYGWVPHQAASLELYLSLASLPAGGLGAARTGGQLGAKAVSKLAGESTDDIAALARSRADELQAALPEGSQGRVTMGVGVGRDAQGNLRTVVGTSEPKGYLRPGISLNPGEELARGFGHAEDDIVYHMTRNRIEPVSVAAGRPICSRCGRLIHGSGARPGSAVR